MTEPVVKAPIPPARKKRNIAIALSLIAFVVIIYVVTLLKMHVHGGAQ